MGDVYFNEPFELNSLQRHIAYCAVAPTTLRNMEADRNSICDWLGQVDLGILTQDTFPDCIDLWTSELVKWGRGPWGAVRKAINLFLRDCALNFAVREKHRLQSIEPSFEIPLDSQTMLALRGIARLSESQLAKSTVKALYPELSLSYQKVASSYAKDMGVLRVQLDMLWWNTYRPACPLPLSSADGPLNQTRTILG